jgi:hypothetical protein
MGWLALGALLPGVVAVGPGRGADREAAAFRLPGTAAPRLAHLFTPRHAPPGAYEVTVLSASLEQSRATLLSAVRDVGGGAAADVPPVVELDPLQAFGEAGSYPQTTVARLYTGRKARLVRIPIEQDGRTVAAVTLVSPYPDPTLSRLEEGTMAILLHLENIPVRRSPLDVARNDRVAVRSSHRQ